jgi:DNA topoisomerase-2
MLNVREATTKKMTENSEISQLVKILGLNYGEKYASKSDLSKLRYGKLMIMADQDQDGSHIKGLVINFIHYKWPNLLKHDYIEVFITPILKVKYFFRILSLQMLVCVGIERFGNDFILFNA